MHVVESKRSICHYLYIMYYVFSSWINNCLYRSIYIFQLPITLTAEDIRETLLSIVSDFWTKGGFGDPENQRFLRNWGLFKVKVSEKGGVFS